MTTDTAKTPWHLWLVGVLAVLFNAVGVFDHTMTLVQGESYMASASMSPAQIAHYQQMPLWMRLDWPLGVWSAFAASILILLRSRLAFPVFVVSLAAFLLSVAYTYLLTKGGEIMGTQMAVTSAVIATLLAVFGAYSWWMTRRGVLR